MAAHFQDAMSVQEAELSMRRRLGTSEQDMLITQSNLAMTYGQLGQHERALQLKRDVHAGRLKLDGEEDEGTLKAANNYASSLGKLQRFEEAKSVLRKTMPVARRVLGESDDATLRMRWCYAKALYLDPGATLDDLREAVATLEDVERIARRVLGGAHPTTEGTEHDLRQARAVLRFREAQV